MEISKENLIVEAEKFRQSKAFTDYLAGYNVDYDIVYQRCAIRLDSPITTLGQAKAFCQFCQFFWSDLPDSPSIRHGAFFTICDFAEFYCFGDDDIPDPDENTTVGRHIDFEDGYFPADLGSEEDEAINPFLAG